MAEAVATEVFAAKPACDADHMAGSPLALEHPQDHHPRARLAVIILQRPLGQKNGPAVVRGLGEFLVATEGFEEILHILG